MAAWCASPSASFGKSILMIETKGSYYTEHKPGKNFPSSFYFATIKPFGVCSAPLKVWVLTFWNQWEAGKCCILYSLGENTSIRPAEDLTRETEGSIRNEWSSTWGSAPRISLLSNHNLSKYTIHLLWLHQLAKVYLAKIKIEKQLCKKCSGKMFSFYFVPFKLLFYFQQSGDFFFIYKL